MFFFLFLGPGPVVIKLESVLNRVCARTLKSHWCWRMYEKSNLKFHLIGRNNEYSVDQKFLQKVYQMRLIEHKNFMLCWACNYFCNHGARSISSYLLHRMWWNFITCGPYDPYDNLQILFLTFYSIDTHFDASKTDSFWKHCGEKKKLLVTSNFLFSLSVFYSIR